MTAASVLDRLLEASHTHPSFPPLSDAQRSRVEALVAARPELLETLAYADLLLAQACGQRHPVALAHFERVVMPKVRAALARVDPSEQFLDEAAAVVRERLLTGPEPRILQYSGEAPLSAWARIAATRLALNLKRGAARADARDELTEAVPQVSAELGLMREQLNDRFTTALQEALAALDQPSRLLLQQHLVDRLSLEKLGVMWGVHKSTLSRRLQRIEGDLAAQVRANLERRFGISGPELQSALRLFSQGLHVSVRRLLATEPGER